MFKTIIFECGLIHVCSSSSTCEIIFWMFKGVNVSKENSHRETNIFFRETNILFS